MIEMMPAPEAASMYPGPPSTCGSVSSSKAPSATAFVARFSATAISGRSNALSTTISVSTATIASASTSHGTRAVLAFV